MNSGGPIHIVFAPDRHYAAHTYVAMASVLRRSRAAAAMIFHVLGSPLALAPATRRAYEQLAADHGARVEWVALDDDSVAGLSGKWGHMTVATFYRLLIPEVLPRLERCLYLDGDVVALDDVAKLWAEDVSGAAFGAVREKICGEPIANFPAARYVFNAGVLLLNLRRFRERGYGRECLRLAREIEWRGGCADQDVLNAVCAGDCQLLDPRWNIQSGQPRRASPGLAHFTGRDKPWHFYFGHPYAAEYWRVRWRTPWRWPSAAELARLPARLPGRLVRIRLNPRKGLWRLSVLGWKLIDLAPASAADGEVGPSGKKLS